MSEDTKPPYGAPAEPDPFAQPATPEDSPPDSVHGVSIDLGPSPAPLEFARRPTQHPTPPPVAPAPRPGSRPPLPVPSRTGKPFDPRLVVPLDLLDPSLPSSKEALQKRKAERARNIRIALLTTGGILAGALAAVITMAVLRQKAPEPLPPELDVSFEVQSDPAGALIFVDGKSTGLQTPSQLKGWEFAADHTVSLELKGYYAERRKVAAGLHPPDLNVILPRVAHLSASTTPVPASVLVDGEAVGTTPAEIDLPADRDIKLALHTPGFVTVKRDLRLKPDESTSVVAALDPLAMVAIKSTPPGARVSVDGATAVTAPADLELTAGAVHRIQASVPGLPPVIRSIKVPPGKTEHLNLTFEDPRDRRARAELSRLRSREAVARRKLSRTEARPGDEYMANARKLNEENSLSDELERIEAREQELEDEIANHDQELEDRIKAAALEASAPRPPGSPGDARPETQAEKP